MAKSNFIRFRVDLPREVAEKYIDRATKAGVSTPTILKVVLSSLSDDVEKLPKVTQ